MARKQYKWIHKLINRITKSGQSDNDHFFYYGYEITLMSGTRDYVSVLIQKPRVDGWKDNLADFSFDYWTKELAFDNYKDYNLRNAIISSFKKLYCGIKIDYDYPWESEKKSLEQFLGNENWDQDDINKQLEKLEKYNPSKLL